MITQARMDYVADVALLPLTLLINFSLCQYLMGMFFSRRSQPLTFLLLSCSCLGFLAIVPFSIPDDHVFVLLNDISETASNLTFLIQIVILGRDICKKVKIRSLVWISNVSLGVIFMELLLILLTILKIADERLHLDWLDDANKAAQGLSLWFIFVFRFYYVGMARGFHKVLATRRMEMFLYLLFATNEYPFLILNATTGVIWDPVQAFWHRFTLLLCLLHTIREKIRSHSGGSKKTTHIGKSVLAHDGTFSKAASKQSVGPMEETVHKAKRRAHPANLSQGSSKSRLSFGKGLSFRRLAHIGLGMSFKSLRSVTPAVPGVKLGPSKKRLRTHR